LYGIVDGEARGGAEELPSLLKIRPRLEFCQELEGAVTFQRQRNGWNGCVSVASAPSNLRKTVICESPAGSAPTMDDVSSRPNSSRFSAKGAALGFTSAL
jgi:hypothetical protein